MVLQNIKALLKKPVKEVCRHVFGWTDGRIYRGKLVPPLTFRSQKGKKNPRAKDQPGVIFSQILTNTLRVYLYSSTQM